MRTLYSLGVAAILLTSPAMAQVVIGGDNDAARHEHRAMQDRADAHRDSAEARQDAAMGDYRGAAREQNEARQEWRDSRHQEHRADQDDHGGVSIQLGR
jgi:hypothetical protein